MWYTKQVPKRYNAEWSSPVARRAHNPKVVGSNPASATMAWPPRPTLPAPLERGGLTFVQNLSVCLVSQASKVFCPDTAVAAEAHPARPPRKRGLTFVQNLSVCLVSQASKAFCPDTAVAAEARPTCPPRKRGAYPLRRIPVTAWSPRHPKCFTLTVTRMAFAMRAFLCLCGFAGF